MTGPVKTKPKDIATEGVTSPRDATPANPDASSPQDANSGDTVSPTLPKEFGGQKGPEPTRYGDWEKNGRCTDF